MINGADKFENEIMEYILRKEGSEFLEHLPFLKIEKREDTGVGSYLYFEYLSDPPVTMKINQTLGQSVYAEIEGLKGGAGFLLYIDEGRITMLECFSHASQAWPSHISHFAIQDL